MSAVPGQSLGLILGVAGDVVEEGGFLVVIVFRVGQGGRRIALKSVAGEFLQNLFLAELGVEGFEIEVLLRLGRCVSSATVVLVVAVVGTRRVPRLRSGGRWQS